MIKVGLVGEDPHDTSSIKNLLENKYKKRIQLHVLVKRIRGCHLDTPKVKKSLPIEFKDRKCQFIIYVRDLDAFQSENAKLAAKRKWFKDLDAIVNNKGILLLNIWELEALILSDINTFNGIYNVQYNFAGDPMLQKDPKELLKIITSKSKKQYSESHCPSIFNKLNFDEIVKNCRGFRDFVDKFEKKI